MVSGYQNGTIAQLLQAIIGQINFDGEPISNIGDILLSILEQTPYDDEPKSVLAELFLKLKDKLEGRAFTPYDKEPTSVIAEILLSILNETEYDKEPKSRIAELLLELKAELESYAEITVSGAIANFTTSVVKPLVNLKAYFEATGGGGTPTSPIAINGFSEAVIARTGKNLVNIKPLNEWETSSSYYLLFNCVPNKKVRMNFIDKDTSVDVSDIYFGFVDSNYDKISGLRPQQYKWCMNQGNIFSITNLSQQGGIILTGLIIYPNTEDIFNRLFARYNFIISVNDETTYEPYNPNSETYTLALGQTVYGGEIDATNGKLKITHQICDLGDYSWSISSLGGGRVYSQKTDMLVGALNVVYYDIVSNKYISASWNSTDLSIERYNTLIRVHDSNFEGMTPEEIQTALVGTKAVYPLKTPIEIDITPQAITALVGTNNVWNDSGDTSVTYLAKIEDNLRSTAKFRANLKAEKQKLKEQKELKELEEKETIKEPTKEIGETKK